MIAQSKGNQCKINNNEKRVINNTHVVLITMKLKINKTYVITYKTVYKNKESV